MFQYNTAPVSNLLPKFRFTPQQLTPSKTRLVVFSTYMVSPRDFYVQPESSSEELRMLMDRICLACEGSQGDTTIELSQLAPLDACLAKFKDDSLWYRAQVKLYLFYHVLNKMKGGRVFYYS
jgi:hypothetical protein